MAARPRYGNGEVSGTTPRVPRPPTRFDTPV